MSAPWTPSNGATATYHLHCHCAAIRYTMTISPPLYASDTPASDPTQCTAIECDCSHCQRHGLIAAHPLAKDVVFDPEGLEHRRQYWAGAKRNPHWFCGKCACVLGTDLTWLMENVFGGEARCCVNLRMLKDFDVGKLEIRRVEGMKDMPPKYEV